MTCERCKHDETITVECRDARGDWRLCVVCLNEINRDNAELRKASDTTRAAPAALGQRRGQ